MLRVRFDNPRSTSEFSMVKIDALGSLLPPPLFPEPDWRWGGEATLSQLSTIPDPGKIF